MSRTLIDDVFDTDDDNPALHIGKACGYVAVAVWYARGGNSLGTTWRSDRWRKAWVIGSVVAAVLEVGVAISKFKKAEPIEEAVEDGFFPPPYRFGDNAEHSV